MSPLMELFKKLTGQAKNSQKPATNQLDPSYDPLAQDEEINLPPGAAIGVQGFQGNSNQLQGVQGFQGNSQLQGLVGVQGFQGNQLQGLQGLGGNQGFWPPQAVNVTVTSGTGGIKEITLSAEGLGKKVAIQGFGVLVWDGKEWRLDGKKVGDVVAGPIGELGSRTISS